MSPPSLPRAPAQPENPFYDTAETQSSLSGNAPGAEATLAAGRGATLTIAEDALVIRGYEDVIGEKSASCCGLLPGKNSGQLSIPYYNVLCATISADGLAITHAKPTSSSSVLPELLSFEIEKSDLALAELWVSELLARAYGKAQQRKRIKVLINPFGGKGLAAKRWVKHIEPIFAAADCVIDAVYTQYRGHAVEIAEELDTEAWDVIACCSGDGVPHEVFNGLGKKADAASALEKVAVVQLPCGTGNAMSLNLNGTESPSLAALAVVKGIRTPFDLVSVTQGDRRILSFLSQSVGIIAESDLGTEHLRWMGSARFTFGILVRILSKTIWPCDIAVGVEIDSKPAIRDAYKRHISRPSSTDVEQRAKYETPGLPPLCYGTVTDPLPATWKMAPYDNLGNFYCGNMAYMTGDVNMFPAALPSDGCMDLVCIDGDLSRKDAITSLTKVETGEIFDEQYVNYRKVTGYRIIPKGSNRKKGGGGEDGYISIDGERVPYEPFQAEVHRGLATVLSLTGRLYEAKGVA